MEKIENVYDDISNIIGELDIDEVMKNKLFGLNDRLEELKNKFDSKIDILIDCMSNEELKIFMEYTVMMLKKYDLGNGAEKVHLCDNQIYDYSKLENISKVLENSIVVIDDFEKFEDDVLCSKYSINKFFNTIKSKKCMIVMTCPDRIEDYYDNEFTIQKFNPDLCIHIKGEEENIEKIYNRLIGEYKRHNIAYKLNKKQMIDVINKIIEQKICSNYVCCTYLYDYSLKRKIIENKDKITIELFNNLVPIIEKENELNKLVGLKNVKNEIDTLKNYLNFKNKTKKRLNKMYLNMFFLGNPGTGKTTVARMLARNLYDLGYIKYNKVVEIVPNDLMANYVGQTKDQTRKILKQAEGGILFIDEAYMLANVVYSDGFASYMKEAISELLKYLEDPKNVVIFAGYKDEMKKVYDSNPGIKSRIFKEIEFPDYSLEELYKILKNNLDDIGISVDKKAKEKIIKYINEEKNKTNFGNARTMEQFAQILVTNHANRKLKKENFLITIEDIPNSDLESSKFGFIGG